MTQERKPPSPDKRAILNEQGIGHLRAIIRAGGTWLTDLDGTIKEEAADAATGQRFVAEIPLALAKLHARGIPLGIITDQSLRIIMPFIQQLATATLASDTSKACELFTGAIFAEGGCVIQSGIGPDQGKIRILASNRAREEMHRVLNHIQDNMTEDTGGWHTLSGVDLSTGTRVMLPPEDERGIGSLNLWCKGPNTDNPLYRGQYDEIGRWMDQTFEDLEIQHLAHYEDGTGTRKVVPRGLAGKHRIMGRLAVQGVIDPSKLIFSCNGINDFELANWLVSQGGGVIAVGDSIEPLLQVATYACQFPSGRGFAEAVEKILD